MKIELHEISVGEIAENYVDNAEEGVVGYGGKLNIRPKYQREFVYDEKKRNAVIDTIVKGFPLNVMYWVKNEDGSFEVLDGQQRTISFCQYVSGDFSVKSRAFHNLTKTEQQQILAYKVLVYFCEGNDREKLDWFRIINIAGEKLTEQELRNATYTGPWLTHAKSIFSKSNCAAYLLAKDYVSGSPIRQEILETALGWISKGHIEDYMSLHQHDPNANELWTYFRGVIEWVKLTFPKYRREMKGLNWGTLYDQFHRNLYYTTALEAWISVLMADDDVTNKKGVYPYVLTGMEKFLNLRAFTESQKRQAYERQGGLCPYCVAENRNVRYEFSEMEGDHITPWCEGGKSGIENMLDAIQKGIVLDSTKKRLSDLEEQQKQLTIEIAEEQIKRPILTREQILFGLCKFRKLDTATTEGKRVLINAFVNSIYLFDDYTVITCNYKEGTETITFEDIEDSELGEFLETQKNKPEQGCSDLSRLGDPYGNRTHVTTVKG